MKAERANRYKDKLLLAEKRIDEIEEWKDDFGRDEKTKLACYKALQEIVEVCMDMIAMMLSDSKKLTKDDYSNIELVLENKLIDLKISNALKEANGLRNRVTHEYNGVSDKIAFKSMIRLIPFIEDFLIKVEEWLKHELIK